MAMLLPRSAFISPLPFLEKKTTVTFWYVSNNKQANQNLALMYALSTNPDTSFLIPPSGYYKGWSAGNDLTDYFEDVKKRLSSTLN